MDKSVDYVRLHIEGDGAINTNAPRSFECGIGDGVQSIKIEVTPELAKRIVGVFLWQIFAGTEVIMFRDTFEYFHELKDKAHV